MKLALAFLDGSKNYKKDLCSRLFWPFTNVVLFGLLKRTQFQKFVKNSKQSILIIKNDNNSEILSGILLHFEIG